MSGSRRLDIADVIGTTARVLAGSFPAFFVTALVCMAPAILVEVWLLDWRTGAYGLAPEPAYDDYGYDPYGSVYDDYGSYVTREEELLRISVLALFGSGLATAFCIAATQAGVLYTVVEHLAGRRASLGSALAKGLSRLPAALGAMVLVSCMTLFGAGCAIIPGLIVALLFCFAVPAAVIEDKPPFKAVARSVDLTNGNRALLLAIVTVVLGLFAAVRWGMRAAWGVAPLFIVDSLEVPSEPPAWSYYVLFALVAVLEAITLASLSSVMYARLRERDGMNIDELAEVFA